MAALAALPETRPAGEAPTATRWRWTPRAWLSSLEASVRDMDRQARLASLLYAAVLLVNSGILMSTVSLYVGQRWGSSVSAGSRTIGVASLSGAMLALRSRSAMLAGPLVGAVSDRTQKRWPVVWRALALGAVGFLLLSLRLPWWVGLLGVLVVAVASAVLTSTIAALVGDRAHGGRTGLTMGSLAAAGDLGSAAGPLLAYTLAATLDLRWVYLMCAGILGAGLAASLWAAGGKENR